MQIDAVSQAIDSRGDGSIIALSLDPWIEAPEIRLVHHLSWM